MIYFYLFFYHTRNMIKLTKKSLSTFKETKDFCLSSLFIQAHSTLDGFNNLNDDNHGK